MIKQNCIKYVSGCLGPILGMGHVLGSEKKISKSGSLCPTVFSLEIVVEVAEWKVVGGWKQLEWEVMEVVV